MLNRNDKSKLGKAQQAALDALKEAGENGLDTLQLIQAAGTRAPARVWELCNMGHVVKKERVAGDRLLWRYTYLGYSDSKQLLLFHKAA